MKQNAQNVKIKNINNNKNFYTKINNLEKLEKELEQKQNKTNFFYELYGKGLFNLGSVKENNI